MRRARWITNAARAMSGLILCCVVTVLLAYAMPLKTIYLTGKRPSAMPQLDAAAAQALILDGRGWSNKDRDSFYDQLDEEGLLIRLGSWSPVVRERAAMTLARRGDAPVVPKLVKLLDSPRLEARYGACQALALLKGAAAPAVPTLKNALRHDDLWLRIKAADALAGVGEPAMSAVPELLQMLAQAPSETDPRGMQQRYLCFALFNPRGGLISRSLEGVDRELLAQAVRAGLRNEDGRARGALGSVYENLTYDEIKPLLPTIHEAIVTPAPSGIMFASGIRLSGVELLAKHRIREGLPLCIQIMEIDRWGKKDRITRCLKTLAMYGAAAKAVLPELRQLEQNLLDHREARMLEPVIQQTQTLIEEIENASGTVELRGIDDP